jgi:hypothetical protein
LDDSSPTAELTFERTLAWRIVVACRRDTSEEPAGGHGVTVKSCDVV